MLLYPWAVLNTFITVKHLLLIPQDGTGRESGTTPDCRHASLFLVLQTFTGAKPWLWILTLPWIYKAVLGERCQIRTDILRETSNHLLMEIQHDISPSMKSMWRRRTNISLSRLHLYFKFPRQPSSTRTWWDLAVAGANLSIFFPSYPQVRSGLFVQSLFT